MEKKYIEKNDRTTSLDNLLNLNYLFDYELFSTFINEFSSFIGSYDKSYSYNQSFLPTMFDNFVIYLNKINNSITLLDKILLILNEFNELHKSSNADLKDTDKANFIVSINNYLVANLLNERKIKKGQSCTNLFKSEDKCLVTFEFKNEITTFYCFDSNDELDVAVINFHFDHLINNYQLLNYKNNQKEVLKNERL